MRKYASTRNTEEMKNRTGIGYILREVTIVVVGVLIAVSIGNYKEKKDNEKYVEKTLVAIENEIKSSQAEVDTVLNRHLRLLEILENEMDNSEQSLGDLVSSSGGFQVASIKNVSLRFFISNKAELLEFQVISQLLDIEAQTELLSDKIERLGDFSYNRINDTTQETKLNFAYLVANVLDSEQSLLESYSRFLEENEGFLKKNN